MGTRAPRKLSRLSKKTKAAPPTALAGREDRSKRLLDLVVLLLGARQPVTYREIRSQFKAYQTTQEEAGLRAFERDKADLVELGVPLRYVVPDEDETIDEPGYVVDLRRYKLPPLHFTPDEAAALVLAGSVAHAAAGTTYDEVVALALKKLAFDTTEGARPDTPRDLRAAAAAAQPVLVHFPHPQAQAAERGVLDERLAILEQATVNRKRLMFRYVNASTGEIRERTVDPYGLVYRQGVWLIVAYCHLRRGVRSFRADRVTDLQVAPKPRTPDFERPPGFDVRRYAGRSPWTFESEPPVEIELLVRAEAKNMANEELGEGATRAPQPDGSILVRFACTNPEYLISRVLSAKGGLLVRGPERMRARVREELERVRARHESGS